MFDGKVPRDMRRPNSIEVEFSREPPELAPRGQEDEGIGPRPAVADGKKHEAEASAISWGARIRGLVKGTYDWALGRKGRLDPIKATTGEIAKGVASTTADLLENLWQQFPESRRSILTLLGGLTPSEVLRWSSVADQFEGPEPVEPTKKDEALSLLIELGALVAAGAAAGPVVAGVLGGSLIAGRHMPKTMKAVLASTLMPAKGLWDQLINIANSRFYKGPEVGTLKLLVPYAFSAVRDAQDPKSSFGKIASESTMAAVSELANDLGDASAQTKHNMDSALRGVSSYLAEILKSKAEPGKEKTGAKKTDVLEGFVNIIKDKPAAGAHMLLVMSDLISLASKRGIVDQVAHQAITKEMQSAMGTHSDAFEGAAQLLRVMTAASQGGITGMSTQLAVEVFLKSMLWESLQKSFLKNQIVKQSNGSTLIAPLLKVINGEKFGQLSKSALSEASGIQNNMVDHILSSKDVETSPQMLEMLKDVKEKGDPISYWDLVKVISGIAELNHTSEAIVGGVDRLKRLFQ